MGIWGCVHACACVGVCVLGVCLLPPVMLPTRFWTWPTPDTSSHSIIYCETTLMKTVTRPIPSTTQLFSSTSTMAPQGRQRNLTGLVCHEPKDRSSNNLCVQHTRRHHMAGCMHAHTMNANMNNCLKEDKAFLQLNWNPRLQSQLPHHHLWLIPQTLPSSSLHFSLCRISVTSKKITKWHYFLHPFNLPFPSYNSSHHIQKHLPNPSKLSTCIYGFIPISLVRANFHPLPFHSTHLHALLFPLTIQTCINFLQL